MSRAFSCGAAADGPARAAARVRDWGKITRAATRCAQERRRSTVLPTRNPKIIFKALATGAVLYSPQDEVYFGLNPVGVRVWELLPPVSKHFDEVCRTLEGEYPEAPAEMIRADVAELLEELGKLGLVVPADASAPQSS
jgi:hypothetical protein